jgi:5'-nucleotidase
MSKLVIAVSSRVLFNLDSEHQLFLSKGVDEYRDYQIQNETKILKKGVAFGIVEKLLNIKSPVTGDALVEVVMVSRNHGDVGLRIFNSIEHYGLNIQKGAFTKGGSRSEYIKAYGVDLFLSAHAKEVKSCLDNGIAAAHLRVDGSFVSNECDDEPLRIGFDGDAVLFSSASESLFKSGGLKAFTEHEVANENVPLEDGLFKGFLSGLHDIQSCFGIDDVPIRTCMITARCSPTHKRVLKTIRHWGLRMDESVFLGGLDKGEFVKAFGADIFFDDQLKNVQSVSDVGILGGHVSVDL